MRLSKLFARSIAINLNYDFQRLHAINTNKFDLSVIGSKYCMLNSHNIIQYNIQLLGNRENIALM